MQRVAFFHPDLGIGGAERLIIEIALALKKEGHAVKIFTSHHDPEHCFEETVNDELEVECHFDWLPRSVFKGFMAYLAALRMILLSIYFLIFYRKNYDVIFLDQIAIVSAPIFKVFKFPVIFYCHFPDKLLSPRNTTIKAFYRITIDFMEGFCMKFPDLILVNSQFTQRTVLEAFPHLKSRVEDNNDKLKVVYPCVTLNKFDITLPHVLFSRIYFPTCTKHLFLSINRYERKKKIEIAIEAFNDLKNYLTPEEWNDCFFIHIGGYDVNLKENVEYFDELSSRCFDLKLLNGDDVNFNKVNLVKNPSDMVKFGLLQKAIALLYTPENEHFGIVPVEAMLMSVPVIAVNSGGPLESIINDVTGFLVPQTYQHFREKMTFFIRNEEARYKMKLSAHEHARNNFTDESLRTSMKEVFRILFF